MKRFYVERNAANKSMFYVKDRENPSQNKALCWDMADAKFIAKQFNDLYEE